MTEPSHNKIRDYAVYELPIYGMVGCTAIFFFFFGCFLITDKHEYQEGIISITISILLMVSIYNLNKVWRKYV